MLQMPMVVVGTKKDAAKRRVVQAYEGQALAKQYGCPFLEVRHPKQRGGSYRRDDY